MNEIEIKEIVQKERDYFFSGETLRIEKRIEILKKIKENLFKYQEEIKEAFILDFNKCAFDVISTEFLGVISEIDYMVKHIKKFSKKKRVRSNLVNFPSHGYLCYEPYGVVLIMAPWNYPLQLSLVPLVGAIASGNTVVLKPSNYSFNVSNVINKVLKDIDDRIINVILGGRNENQALLDSEFDYIFFTGGDKVGRLVMEKASKNLTPVSLELGGKSPTIVTKSADINLAAKRITWAKYLNAGQTCVAPDYILVDKSIHDEFIINVKKWIDKFYYVDEVISNDFPYIINDKHVERLKGLIDDKKIIKGGRIEGRLIEPIILDNVYYEDNVMQEEIFGPIMPIIIYDNLEKEVEKIKRGPHPLALYLYTKDKNDEKLVFDNIAFGGGCLNDSIMHLTNDKLPFGGVGRSGMGSYHGKKSFYTFSHEKSIFVKGKMELDVKYPPHTEKKTKLIKKFAKLK